MELVIGFGFVSQEHSIDFSGEIDVHMSAVDLWMTDPNEEDVEMPTLVEAVKAEMLKAFMLSYEGHIMRQIRAQAMDWDECFYIHNVKVEDTTRNVDEPVMEYNLNADTVEEVVELYEWLDPEARTNWSEATAWLAYHDENGYSIEFDNFDRWLQDSYCGTYDSLEDYASAHEIYIPAGCGITDEDEFMSNNGEEFIVASNGDYIVYYQ